MQNEKIIKLSEYNFSN